jgi:hypothetical protein
LKNLKKITCIKELKEAIVLLELKQTAEGVLLKEQFKLTYESLKPINLIKSQLKELVLDREFKGDVLNTSLGLISGALSKKLAIGNTNNPVKLLLGDILRIGVTNAVTKNGDSILSKIYNIITKLSAKSTNAN